MIRANILNDHFDRISRGRQILAYGDHPFADFRDPGYFLTLYVSAAAQAASGGGLLGEVVVTSAAMAAAGAVTFYLAAMASGSLTIALLAACLTAVVSPRYYDYDKVFFYTVGLALCWRYVDAPGRGRLAAAAFITATAALFRYDNGLFVLAACITAITVRRWREPARLARDVTLYVGVVLIALAPALLFVHLTAGIPEAFRQVAAYATVEGRRSDLFTMPRLTLDRTSLLYVMSIAIGPMALLQLAVRARQNPGPLLFATPKIAAAAVLCACVCVFVLRDPLNARVGAAMPLLAVLAAAMAGYGWSQRQLSFAVLLLMAAFATGIAVTFAQQDGRLLRAPSIVAGRLQSLVRNPTDSPPHPMYFPDNAALAGLARYLRTCTAPDARVLVTWFAPEVFFFAQRGFAGGMAVFLGTHWASDADQRRTIEQMNAQNVPVVIVQAASEQDFRGAFRHVAAHVDRHYRLGGATSFGDPRVPGAGYRVFIRRNLGEVRAEPEWMLPCPQSLITNTNSRLVIGDS